MARWAPHVKRDSDTCWEIAVVRLDNLHGQRSYGWFNRGDKLYISSSGGPCHDTVTPEVWQELLAVADRIAGQMNEKEDL